MKREKIIITGGTGFIGSHTVVEFIQKGFEVVIADNLCNSDITVLENIKSIAGVKPAFKLIDLTNKMEVHIFFLEHKNAIGVINFAALKAVNESIKVPLKYYSNNLNILINVLECMSEFGINNLIFSSSATVYGLPDTLPINEKFETKRPTSPYGNTKKIGEEIIEDFSNISSKFKAISLRYFNPIGAHKSKMLGELPTGTPNNLMPFITQTAAGIRSKLNIFGSDYNTPDGTAIRDYIHVVDLAIAHVNALNRLIKNDSGNNFEVFNLSTGVGYSVLDVVNSFEKVSQQKLKYSFEQRREGDIPVLFADPTKANNELGWNATLSLDEMTQTAWDWEIKNRNF